MPHGFMKKLFVILTLLITTSTAFAKSLPEVVVSDVVTPEPFLKEFSVYPNPSSGKLTVSFSSLTTEQNVTLKVYNLIGQEVQSQTLTTFNGLQSIELNLSELPKGMYMVEMSNGKSSRVKRISLI
jgi:hypothetical protein